MAENSNDQRRWKFGVNRWIILALIIVSIYLSGMFPPARPHIQLPAEELSGSLFGLPQTNTLVATFLADVVLLVLAFFVVGPAVRSGKLFFKGIVGAIEALLEALYNLTEATAGKWAKTIFPWFVGIMLFVLIVNWMELVPGVDSVGEFNIHHYVDTYVEEEAAAMGVAVEDLSSEQLHSLEEKGEHHYWEICTDVVPGEAVGVVANDASGTAECASAVVPYVRVASTDLNFTVALAIISLAATQVVGVMAQGTAYFEKFIYVKTIFSKPFFGMIDFVVGIFEIVSEFSKIISFSFRLFGNIFAGSVLLFVIGTLIPVAAQSGVLIFEFGVGLIQALVFGMLTMIFMAQATQSHHDEEEHHE